MFSQPMELNEPFYKVFYHPGSGNKFAKSSKDDLFGVEIELEGKKVTSVYDEDFAKIWDSHSEGSLKVINPGDQAIEYVFKKPLDMDATDKALTMLHDYMTKPGVEVYNSGRGSVHVHVNVINEKISTIYNFLALAIIFDELLVSQNGVSRIGNNFCLRARDAEGFIVSMADSIRAVGGFQYLKADNRYSSINPMSLFKFGTIEFRSMECTVDRIRLMHWVRTLQALKASARLFNNPREIVDNFSLLGPERFFLNILGAQAIRYMRVVERHHMLYNGVRLCQEFAYASTWTPITEEMKANKTKPYSTKSKKALDAEHYKQILLAAQQGLTPNNWVFNTIPQPIAPADAEELPGSLEEIASEEEDDDFEPDEVEDEDDDF